MKDKKAGLFYGYVVVGASFVIIAVAAGGINSFGVFFAPLLTDFGWTRATTSGAFSLRTLLSGLLALVTGRLNDRFGPRILVTITAVFLGLGYLLMSRINNVGQFYLFYGVIIGIGLSGSMVPLLSATARWFVKRRGIMSGIVTAGAGVGTILVPLLVDWLVTHYNWRPSFIILGIISLVVMIVMAQFLRSEPASKGQFADGATELSEKDTIAGASGLSFWEAIHTRPLWMLWVASFCIGFIMISIIVHIVIHATGLGIPASRAVSILSVIGASNIAGRLLIGGATDRIGSRSALLISLVIALVSLIWLQFAKTLWMFYVFSSIFGFAWGGSGVPSSPMIAELFGLKSHGLLFGLVNVGFTMGGAVGPVLVGYIFDVRGSYQLAFLICLAVSIIGLTLAWLLKLSNQSKLGVS